VDADEQAVAERERALLSPEVRRDPERVLALLHPEFVEFGASGRVWDRTSVSEVTSGTDERIAVEALRTRRLGPDAVLVTYVSDAAGRRARRTSVWVRDVTGTTGWLLLHHQGTLAG
jgi:hypothetical protein